MKHTARVNPDKLTIYTLKVVVEPDEDAWHAYCPALSAYGAATSGRTREEALRHIREVVEMVIAELIEDGIALPQEEQVSDEPFVSVTV